MGKTLQFQNIGDRGNWVDDEWVTARWPESTETWKRYF